jgi:multidrug transporter EmrE-like cation transporter
MLQFYDGPPGLVLFGLPTVTLSIGMTLLILLAAVMHASWNVLVKFGNDAFLNMGLIVGLGGILGLLFTPFVDFPERASWIWLFGSCVCHLGYYTFLVTAYRHGELSQVYPMARGSAPPLVALASWLLYGQTLNPLQAAGVAAN